MRQVFGRVVLAAALGCAGMVACEDDDGDTTTGTDNVGAEGDGGTSRADGGTSGGADGTSGGDAGSSDLDGGNGSGDGEDSDGGAGSSGDAQPEMDLTDPEIGAVTSTLNMGEVAQANAALPKLTDAEAKAFAQEMVTAHTAAQMRQAALLQRKGIAPAENALSMMLQQESNAIVAELMTASQDVDTLYIQTQVDVHAKALDTLDNVLIPSADDADLKAELEATRGEVKTHLDHAQEILEALGG